MNADLQDFRGSENEEPINRREQREQKELADLFSVSSATSC
jgi:hypothetical protein